MIKLTILLLVTVSVTFMGCGKEADFNEVQDKQQLTELVNRLFMYTDD